MISWKKIYIAGKPILRMMANNWIALLFGLMGVSVGYAPDNTLELETVAACCIAVSSRCSCKNLYKASLLSLSLSISINRWILAGISFVLIWQEILVYKNH